jgi:multimeric flavodoxin WrbA
MLMRVLAFNGSGRKNWNTAQLVGKFVEGAKSAGASTELVHLSDLKFSGCRGCLSCKLIGTPKYNHCQVKDDLTKYLDTLPTYDVLCFATPIYFLSESGMMRSCLERVLFQFYDYDKVPSKYPGKTSVAYVATMNIAADAFERYRRFGMSLNYTQTFMKAIFGNCSVLYAFDTLQVPDYKKYHIT